MGEKDKYTIKGSVTDRRNGSGVANLTVEAWDKDLLIDDLLGSAVTDQQGRFTLGFEETHYREICLDRRPDVYFKVFDEGRLIESTQDSVLWNVKAGTVTVQIPVSMPGPRKKFVLSGRLTDRTGNPLDGLTVQALRRYLRREVTLGSAQTEEKGRYSISIAMPDAESAELLVAFKIFDPQENLLHQSKIYHLSPQNAAIDIVVPVYVPGFSTFERLVRRLQPLLVQGLVFEDLEQDDQHDDICFLAGETDMAKEAIARLSMAHKLARQAIEPQFWFAILDGSFFRYDDQKSLDGQLAEILDSLPSLNAAAVQKALTRALNLKEISEACRGKIAEWLEAFQQFAAGRLLIDTDRPGFVKSALAHAGIDDPAQKDKFARLFNEHKSLVPELLQALEEDGTFNKAQVADLRASFRLADLTQGDFSVVKTIKDEFDIRQPERIAALAKKSEDEWVNLIVEKYDAGGLNLPFEMGELPEAVKFPKAEIYGKSIARRFQHAFPTIAFSGGLERAMHNGGTVGIRHSQELSGFLSAHQDFELLRTNIDEYFNSGIHPDFEPLVKNEAFAQEVKAIQRVFKLLPTFEATDALLANNIHSAQQIYRMGEAEFVQRYAGHGGMTAKDARLAWRRAADTHAAVISIVGDLQAHDSETLPIVLKNNGEALSAFPEWHNLFKTGDLCECEHCRSVLSPAAYLADLLMFLKERNSLVPKPDGSYHSAKDILFRRRPDIGYIELNCDNALVSLPYIDVVCEVLEAVVADGENDIELTGFTDMPGDPVAAQAAVAAALAGHQIDPGSDFTLSQVDPDDPDRWVAHGDHATYLIKKKETANFFAEVLRNTKASAAELCAYPQYVNPKAYEKLVAARYPFSLPFDLPAEEVRAGFQKSNLMRWELMSTLRGAAPPHNPTEGEIAADYFGISFNRNAEFDEKRLILEADPTKAGQQAVWGESGAGWLDAVGSVDTFLLKTGLQYNELLALLDLPFINPDGDMVIQHEDASCDTERKTIQALDAAKLDRMHRFLRLWRKLEGWQMWELDLVLRNAGIGAAATPAWELNEQFLVNLFYFDRLKNRLGKKATIEKMCALFDNLNTASRFTALHQKRDEGLYQSLFLNKRLIQPLDPSFEVDSGTGDLPAGGTISAHHTVVLAALGIRESDLELLKNLPRPSDGMPYINDDLTLGNLSFVWRHAWMTKLLKLSAAQWQVMLKIFQHELLRFANPQQAWQFFEKIGHFQAAAFSPDELNWLLSGDRTAQAALSETDAARFLAALRKELHAVWDEYDILPPTDVEGLSEKLTTMLQTLKRSESEVISFIAALRGGVQLETGVRGMPAGFGFPGAINGAPNFIPIEYHETGSLFRFNGLMTDAHRTILLTEPSLADEIRNSASYQIAIEELHQQAQAAIRQYVCTEIDAVLPAGLQMPVELPSIPIRYDAANEKLSFIGVMTESERAALIDEGNPAPLIEELFLQALLGVKFFEPVFTAALERLPLEIDFASQLQPDLAAKVTYDAQQLELRFAGILNPSERADLEALSADTDYRNAVGSLFDQPRSIVSPDARIWMAGSDLDPAIPANDTLAKRMGNALTKALSYLSNTLAKKLIISRSAAQLQLTEALTERLLTRYAVLPETLMSHLTDVFGPTTTVVDYTTMKATFDGWYWAGRVAALLKKWQITPTEWDQLAAITANARLLDFATLPVDADTGAIPSAEHFYRTSRLLKLKSRMPENRITLLQVLQNLSSGIYAEASDFAANAALLNDNWLVADLEGLVGALDLVYPHDYLLAENWERLCHALYFLDNLNTGVETAQAFAAEAMTVVHAKTIMELLRSKFGSETWLTLCAEIQDVLRERKRDALTAYLLAQAMPDHAPAEKWENANDLYAYYLLDVEMSACHLTSRIVQGSGSVQLFVQRCFMGLEPDVAVQTGGDDGDSAWRWWDWMRKYRVWEANRKVFLWPENWIAPELKKDRSSFFKDLENELLQNEINQYNVEKAFLSYLEKLDQVGRLEIAGFFQKDDGDNSIVHVFGRTTGAEPHIYYYRRYDYRQWTPWEKVDADIQGDYLVPAVIDHRLFLFWPVFTEVPDEQQNKAAKVPSGGEPDFEPTPAKKKLRLQMAVSEYRQGQWTPKRVSKDFDESQWYCVDIVKKHYQFYPVDRSELDGRFGIKYEGFSYGSDGGLYANFNGAFEISGCTGVPERSNLTTSFETVLRAEEAATGERPVFLKWMELGQMDEFGNNTGRVDSQDDFTVECANPVAPGSRRSSAVLMQTPGIFKMYPPWHLSYLDRLWLDGTRFAKLLTIGRDFAPTVGSWLPFFYEDRTRSFFVLPSLWGNLSSLAPKDPQSTTETGTASGGWVRNYYPEIKDFFHEWEIHFEGQVHTWVDNSDLSDLTPAQRQGWELFLHQQFSQETPPPYTNEQFRRLAVRFLMRFYHFYIGAMSFNFLQFNQFRFKNFYHPFVCDFAKLVYNPLKGIPALMSRDTQLKNTGFSFYQTYRPTLCVAEDFPLQFAALDIKDLNALALKLSPLEDRVSAYLHDNLSAATISAIANYLDSDLPADQLRELLAEDLNRIITTGTIYDPYRFAGVVLRPKTHLLLDLEVRGAALIHLNRLLLEDAYPRELSRERDAYPQEMVDFSPDGAYASYNWELFFHAPLLIANALSNNQRFEEAREWYHFIFNPLGVETTAPGGSPMSKYWITKPFFETTDPQYIQQRIDNIMRMLAGDDNVPGYSAQAKKDLEDQVIDWRTNPFEPHRIANYRTVAYQKTVVMRYLDNLIAWGDLLFRQDSMESINEATQLYIMAAEILGPRPRKISPQARVPLESFNELQNQLDVFSNALIKMENLVPALPGSGASAADPAPLPMLYFCIPQNDTMLGYWDTVADRLYKIRHCMNIEGVQRQLALFEPPIDPGALVKAVAGGVDFGTALADLSAPLPIYRFNVLLQKANEVCNDVKALGGALLAALEKKDSEALALLRQNQEIRMLEAVQAVRESQIEEAKANLAALVKSKELAQIKQAFYTSREYLNAGETAALALSGVAIGLHTSGVVMDVLGGILAAIPDFDIGVSGFGGSPAAKVKSGGTSFSKAVELAARALYQTSTILDKAAATATTVASYQRRKEDWDFQKDLAEKEIEQLEESIAAAELRIAMAEKELDNHLLQIENAKAVDDFMRSKYTSEELYQWQTGQISGIFFESYKLAYDMAKQAERCFCFELGLKDSSYITFSYWDSLKKGLLSGEKLQYDLRRLETAYLAQNRREYELTRHISLALLDPLALVKLRETGQCFIHLPEEIFDLDFPGHYFRRIKSVSLTLPCIVGPYTSVPCTLRLLKNKIRINTAGGDNDYPHNTDGNGLPSSDDRFVENNIPVNAIAASNAKDDRGVFELNFRDERYLPFEGAGVISEWSLELFHDLPAHNPDFGKPLRQFDYSSISDAILNVKYTAREGAGVFKNSAVDHLRNYFSREGSSHSVRLFDLKHEFPTQWHNFMHPADPATGNVLALEMSPRLFALLDQDKTLNINTIYLLARCSQTGVYNVVMAPPLPGSDTTALVPVNQYGGLHFSQKDVSTMGIQVIPASTTVKWRLTMTRPGGGNLEADPVTGTMEVQDLFMAIGYEWE